MTREQVLALSGIELNQCVAKNVMGWKDIEPASFTGSSVGALRGRHPETDQWFILPDYVCTQAWQVEKEIEQTGMQYQYIKALTWIVARVEKLRDLGEDLFMLVTAKPQDRCKAALLAVLFGEGV